MTRWVQENRAFFERDIVQDFCHVSQIMQEQFARFAASETISFPALRTLVGDSKSKGPLWRLKDTAHLTFADLAAAGPFGGLLDWTLGYIYHESVKLMEDARLRQSYASRLTKLTLEASSAPAALLIKRLLFVQAQTEASMAHEVAALKEFLTLSRQLFSLYFSGKAGHRPLARFLYDNEPLATLAFQEEYPTFISAIYGDYPEGLYIEAVHSLLESARKEDAAKALLAALACNPTSQAALALQEKVFNGA